MKRFITVSVLVLAMLLSTACGQNNAPSSTAAAASSETSTSSAETSSSTESGAEKPKFTVLDDMEFTKLDGTKAKLSELSKRHTIITFWTTWCKYCNEEMPHLIELAKREDVAVVFLNQGESKETVEAHLKNKGYDVDVYLDESMLYGSMFGVNGFPYNVFMTEGRGLMAATPGYVNPEQFEEILKKIDEFREKNNF